MFGEPQIYLASGSPRRRELLDQISVRYQQFAVDVDETVLPAEDPSAYVVRLALAKARAGWRSLGGRLSRPVLGADTAVVIDDKILGKPRDRTEGLAMLALLSGRWHWVMSAVALVSGERERWRLQKSRVRMRTLSSEECQRYWETGEPADKAGGYAIQGLAAVFIAEIRGSYSGVVGLPLFETCELFNAFNIRFLQPKDPDWGTVRQD